MSITSSLITTCLISIGDHGMASELLIKDFPTSDTVKNISEKKNIRYDKEYQQLYTELSTYRELNNNWDGYDGVRPTDEIIATAKDFIDILKNHKIPHPRIMVSGDGEVALFWKNKNNYIEIDFDIKDHLSFFYELDTSIYGEDDVLIDGTIPNKLGYSINYFKNEISSKEVDSLIRNTKHIKIEETNGFLIEVA